MWLPAPSMILTVSHARRSKPGTWHIEQIRKGQRDWVHGRLQKKEVRDANHKLGTSRAAVCTAPNTRRRSGRQACRMSSTTRAWMRWRTHRPPKLLRLTVRACPERAFWTYLDHFSWMHVYDETGRKRGFSDILSRAVAGVSPFWAAMAAGATEVLLHRTVALASVRWGWFETLISGDKRERKAQGPHHRSGPRRGHPQKGGRRAGFCRTRCA